MSHADTVPPPCRCAVERPRVEGRLRTLLQHAAVWVSGPAGTGKTFAAAAVARGAAHCMWYAFDERSTNLDELRLPAAHTLAADGSATDGATAAGLPRPRAHFRQLYAQLPVGTLVVFDNVQHVGGKDTPVLEAAIAEIPATIRVLFLSRGPLPPSLVRLEVAGSIGRLRAHELYFDADETARCLGRHAPDGAETKENIRLD